MTSCFITDYWKLLDHILTKGSLIIFNSANLNTRVFCMCLLCKISPVQHYAEKSNTLKNAIGVTFKHIFVDVAKKA